jgi:hypothetical protein
MGWSYRLRTDAGFVESSTSTPGTGDVVGPASATDGNMAVFDGLTGKLIKDGGVPGSGSLLPITCQGRLTTESGVPVSVSDRVAQSTLYFTPFGGNHVSTYDSGAWADHTFAEISLALSGLTSGKNYDVFIYNNSGTLTLELSAAWADNVTPTDAIGTQDGVSVKSSNHSRRHLGTIRTTGTTTTEDSDVKRFVWNAYNQVPRKLSATDATTNWSYASQTIRQARANAANKVEYVTGDLATMVEAYILATALVINCTTFPAVVGVGLDSTTTFTGDTGVAYNDGSNQTHNSISAQYEGQPGLGYHYISWNESGSDGTAPFFIGNSGNYHSGLLAKLLC